MFRIKICGITRIEDAVAVAASGGDAIGLNFYPGSKRFVPLARAVEISAAAPGSLQRVGVFVNATADEIRRAADEARLDLIQLHGDEPASFAAELAPLPILRALRWTKDGIQRVAHERRELELAGANLAGILIDSFQPGAFGGTGRKFEWDELGVYWQKELRVPLVIAGGLTPSNVADAIESVAPNGVDTAGGVEMAPGVKDPELIRQFVTAALEAW